MPFFEDSWRGGETKPARAKYRSGIAHAVRLEPFQRLIEFPVESLELDRGVDAHLGHEVLRRECLPRVGLERGFQVRDAIRRQGKARRLSVSAEAHEQVLRRGERVEQVETRDGSARAIAYGLASLVLNGDHQGRPVVALGHALRRNADHAAMPAR